LFGFGRGFDLFDAFLKFFLHDFIDKLPTRDEEEVVKVVNGPSVGGVIHDLLAIGEHGIKFLVQQGVNVGRSGAGIHKYLRVKILRKRKATNSLLYNSP